MNKYAVRTFTCVGCQKTITQHAPSGQHYCFLECYRKSKRPQRETGRNIACELCGSIFYASKSRTEKGEHYFCCIEHANEWQGRNKTEHVCKICGITFYWSPSRSKDKKHNITYCSIECRDKDPERAVMLRRMNAKQLSMKPNNLERSAYAILDSIGIPYEAQFLIADKFCVDAFVPSTNTIIQFDGDYWHGNPAKFDTLDYRQSKRVALDKSQDAYMKTCGYRVVRIWESELKKSPEHARQLLTAAIQP